MIKPLYARHQFFAQGSTPSAQVGSSPAAAQEIRAKAAKSLSPPARYATGQEKAARMKAKVKAVA